MFTVQSHALCVLLSVKRLVRGSARVCVFVGVCACVHVCVWVVVCVCVYGYLSGCMHFGESIC